jgi:hypothetical protein
VSDLYGVNSRGRNALHLAVEVSADADKNGQEFTQCAGATAKEAVSKLLNDANATGEAKREGVELDKLDAVGDGVLDRKQSVEGVMSGYDIDDKLRGLYSRAKNFLGESERNPGIGGAKRARRGGRCRQEFDGAKPGFLILIDRQ